MLRRTLTFVAVLMVLNAIFYVFDLPLRINIVGSLVVSALVAAIMYVIDRPRYR